MLQYIIYPYFFNAVQDFFQIFIANTVHKTQIIYNDYSSLHLTHLTKSAQVPLISFYSNVSEVPGANGWDMGDSITT